MVQDSRAILLKLNKNGVPQEGCAGLGNSRLLGDESKKGKNNSNDRSCIREALI